MRVSLKKTVEVDPHAKFDYVAFAGAKGVYRRDMTFRQIINALAENCGTGFLSQVNEWLASPDGQD